MTTSVWSEESKVTLASRLVAFPLLSQIPLDSDYRLGEINLTLIPYEGPPRHALEEGSEFIHLGFWVDDLTATYQRLVSLQAAVVREDVKERREFAGNAPPPAPLRCSTPTAMFWTSVIALMNGAPEQAKFAQSDKSRGILMTQVLYSVM